MYICIITSLLSQVYLIEVTRPKSKEQVFRRYSEFHEMHTKLVCQFPDHTLPALPGKIYVGRSQVRHVSFLIRMYIDHYSRYVYFFNYFSIP